MCILTMPHRASASQVARSSLADGGRQRAPSIVPRICTLAPSCSGVLTHSSSSSSMRVHDIDTPTTPLRFQPPAAVSDIRYCFSVFALSPCDVRITCSNHLLVCNSWMWLPERRQATETFNQEGCKLRPGFTYSIITTSSRSGKCLSDLVTSGSYSSTYA